MNNNNNNNNNNNHGNNNLINNNVIDNIVMNNNMIYHEESRNDNNSEKENKNLQQDFINQNIIDRISKKMIDDDNNDNYNNDKNVNINENGISNSNIDSGIDNNSNDINFEILAVERKEAIKRKRSRLKAYRTEIFSLDENTDLGSDFRITTSSGSGDSDKSDNYDSNLINHNNQHSASASENTHHTTPQRVSSKNTLHSNNMDGNNKVENRVEKASFRSISNQGNRLIGMSKELLRVLKSGKGNGNNHRDIIQSPQIRLNVKQKENITNKKNIESIDRDQDIVQTVDLSSVPLLTAPPIEDQIDFISSTVTFIAPADIYSYPSSSSSSSSSFDELNDEKDSIRGGDKRGYKEGKNNYNEEINYSDVNNDVNETSIRDVDTNNDSNDDDNKGRYNIADLRSILKMEIEGTIEEVEYTDVVYGPSGKNNKKKGCDDAGNERGGERRGSVTVRGRGRGRGKDCAGPEGVGGRDGQGQGQRDGDRSLSYLMRDGQRDTLTDTDPVEARDTSDLGGLRFSPRSVSASSVMTAADEMANDLTSLKNDLGDLDDANVRNLCHPDFHPFLFSNSPPNSAPDSDSLILLIR